MGIQPAYRIGYSASTLQCCVVHFEHEFFVKTRDQSRKKCKYIFIIFKSKENILSKMKKNFVALRSCTDALEVECARDGCTKKDVAIAEK